MLTFKHSSLQRLRIDSLSVFALAVAVAFPGCASETSGDVGNISTSSVGGSARDSIITPGDSGTTHDPKKPKLLLIANDLELCPLTPGARIRLGTIADWTSNFSSSQGSIRLQGGKFDLGANVGPDLSYRSPDGQTFNFESTELKATYVDSGLAEKLTKTAYLEVSGRNEGIKARLGLTITMELGADAYVIDGSFPYTSMSPQEATHSPFKQVSSFLELQKFASFAQNFGFAERRAMQSNAMPRPIPLGSCVWNNRPDDVVRFTIPDRGELSFVVHVDMIRHGTLKPSTVARVIEVFGNLDGVPIRERRASHLAGAAAESVTDWAGNPLAPMWWSVKFDTPIAGFCGLVGEVGWNFDESGAKRYAGNLGAILCSNGQYEHLARTLELPKHLGPEPGS